MHPNLSTAAAAVAAAAAAAVLFHCRCKETGESKCILTALCGHGHFDMASYEKYLSGQMQVG
jgi:tryptophan synthase beta chain